MKNIAVFFGGKSVEHDVSIVTALQLIENMDKQKYNAVPIYITRDGDWYTGEKLKQVKTFEAFDKADPQLTRCYLPANTRARQLFRFETGKQKLFGKKEDPVICTIDAAIPAMHGLHGEDGTLQGLLELAEVPYTSCGVLGSAAGMDKILMKAAFAGGGLPVLPYIYFDRGALPEEAQKIAEWAESRLQYPMFVKPANLGSSIGISKAKNREELLRAMEVASHYDRRILVEQGVDKPVEINCSAMGFGGSVQASVCEMPVTWEDFLTYDEKYMRGGKNAKGGMQSLARQIPAPISEELTEQIRACTVKAFKLLDCKGVVRIDYILDGETLYINEINTIPGSFAFYLWEPMGVSYAQLIDRMLALAFEACEDAKQNDYAFRSDIVKNYGQGKASAKGGKLSVK